MAKLGAMLAVGVFFLTGAGAGSGQRLRAGSGRLDAAAVTAGNPSLAAVGQNGPYASTYTSVTGDDVMGILREMGFVPELTKDDDGDPLVKFQIEGLKTSIYFFEGTGGRYSAIQFFAGFDDTPTLDKVNTWNLKHRYGRSYLSSTGKLRVEYDVALEGGLTKDNLEASVRRWHTVLNTFVEFFRS